MVNNRRLECFPDGFMLRVSSVECSTAKPVNQCKPDWYGPYVGNISGHLITLSYRLFLDFVFAINNLYKTVQLYYHLLAEELQLLFITVILGTPLLCSDDQLLRRQDLMANLCNLFYDLYH